MIEKHYSKYIVEYGDEHARAALLQLKPTIGDNIVPWRVDRWPFCRVVA